MMNKVITEGLELTPPSFAEGLDTWSSGDGTPGSDTYAGSGGGAYVPADQDFGAALEIVKTNSTQRIRYMGETPILSGCYLQVTAWVKCISGALPDVRIAGWAGEDGGAHLDGVTEVGPSVSITGYGDVVKVSAIIGTGRRTGVDMVWAEADYGHIGLDLIGANGGVVRVDDFEIVDITSAFLRDMLGIVDVRDYGAIGDGVSDDSAAFEAADADADGREVLITEGTYFMGGDVTFQNQVRFEGTITQAEEHEFILQRNYDYPTYLDAFGDEELAFKKAFQALLNFSNHESLDLGGRRITLTEPVDMQAAVSNRTSFETRRVIRNGQFHVTPGANWDDEEVTSQASYDTSDSLTLTGVTNIAAIQVGSLITGNGVGREVYVREVDVDAETITLSNPLYDAQGTQVYTFTRFKYMWDFSGFAKLSDFIIDQIDFDCNGNCSAILLPTRGVLMQILDYRFKKPKDRAITSHASGCQGMIIDRSNFESNESGVRSQDRKSLCFNTNNNDCKIRNNRGSHFRHFAVIGGVTNIISGNHWFNGDNEDAGVRLGGLVITQQSPVTTIVGNYIDNNFVEWTNEHSVNPDVSGFSFSGLSITNNIFFCIDVQESYRCIVVKPFGAGNYINGLNVLGNMFRSSGQDFERVEDIDTTFADLDRTRMRNIRFEGNTFNGIDLRTYNPLWGTHQQSTASEIWSVETGDALPFGGYARFIESVIPSSAIRNTSGDRVFVQPYVENRQGVNEDEFHVVWPEPVTGEISYSVRMDDPN